MRCEKAVGMDRGLMTSGGLGGGGDAFTRRPHEKERRPQQQHVRPLLF